MILELTKMMKHVLVYMIGILKSVEKVIRISLLLPKDAVVVVGETIRYPKLRYGFTTIDEKCHHTHLILQLEIQLQ